MNYLARTLKEAQQWEYLVADAKAKNCDTLVFIGVVRSNHTRVAIAVIAASGSKGAQLYTLSVIT